ncbi:MAG TPA: galactokinase family protein [Tepidisphaeraceae bacterium]|jgi:galactokinase|nr:galactokinase family protein [Tepidisphaeraceae bacterium]
MTRDDIIHFTARLTSAGYDPDRAGSRAMLLSHAASILRQRTNDVDDAIAFLVPGRIEFLGKHTDYAGGRSLLCAVERGFGIVAVPREDNTIHIADARDGQQIEFSLGGDLLVGTGHWSNYPMTVARRLARNFPGKLLGADIAFSSDLPPSAGMSSSSALMIAVYLVLAKINRLNEQPIHRDNIHTLEDLAGYLGTIENGQSFRGLAGDRGVGTFGGSQDHTAILCSRPGVLRQYAFCPVRHECDIALPPDYVFAIAASGVVAEKTGAARQAYNAISMSVSAIMDRWRETTGRSDATLGDAIRSRPSALAALREMLGGTDVNGISPSRLIDRLEQFVAESEQIIPAAASALQSGRIDELGTLVDRSQDLSHRWLGNQIPETILLARAARECGAAAASAFGAGFGGSVWALVKNADADAFLAQWRECYVREFPEPAQHAVFFVTSAGKAAHEVL